QAGARDRKSSFGLGVLGSQGPPKPPPEFLPHHFGDAAADRQEIAHELPGGRGEGAALRTLAADLRGHQRLAVWPPSRQGLATLVTAGAYRWTPPLHPPAKRSHGRPSGVSGNGPPMRIRATLTRLPGLPQQPSSSWLRTSSAEIRPSLTTAAD